MITPRKTGMAKPKNHPISIKSLLSFLKPNNNKRKVLDGVECNQFNFPNFRDLNGETEHPIEILNKIKAKPYIPLRFDKSDALSSESIDSILDSMIEVTLGCPIMEELTDSQRVIITTALYEACRVGLNLGFTADAMRLSEKRGTDEEFNNSVKAFPKVYSSKNGSMKNKETRTLATQFLNGILMENPELSINRLALILRADSKENPDKYGKEIKISSCENYARSVKNNYHDGG
jgi:hypothetical protein